MNTRVYPQDLFEKKGTEEKERNKRGWEGREERKWRVEVGEDKEGEGKYII